MSSDTKKFPDPEDKYSINKHTGPKGFKRVEYYDDYYDSDDDEEFPPPKGPLSYMPDISKARPVFFCFILFVITSLLYWQFPIRDKLWASREAVFDHGEYWRLLTSLFTHSDGLHLLSNAPLFLIFGWFLRAYFGVIIFPAASFFIGISATAFTLTFYEPHIRLIGASGMVYGMIALWLIFYIRHDVDHMIPIRIFRAVGFALIMLIPTTYKFTTSYLSHASGFVVGIVTGFLLLPFIPVRTVFKDSEDVE